MKLLKKLSNTLFSTSAAGLYMILFALSIAAATFVENDFGTSSAQKVIFRTRWFEMILVLFGISLIANAIRFRMIQRKKWAVFTFHLAMIVILIGAGVTRYFGSEGMMHIREGSSSDTFLSSGTFLQFEAVRQDRKYVFDEPVLFATLGNNHIKRSYLLGDQALDVEVLDFIPNPVEAMVEDESGVPVVKLVMGGMNGREEYFVKYGEKLQIRGMIFNFGRDEDTGAFNIKYENGQLLFMSGATFTQRQMATQQTDTLSPGLYHPLLLRSLYSNGRESFVPGDFSSHGKVELSSASGKMTSSSVGGLRMKLRFNEEEKEVFVYGSQGVEGMPQRVSFGNTDLSVAYGAKKIDLPFSIRLHDFIMERYPGTNSASSYASEVTLTDPAKNLVRDQRIYMNHILNYGGYRFFQSSFDQDELGAYLSVNHDAWGTRITYFGYLLLTLGMALTLLSKKSRMWQLAQNIKKMRRAGNVPALVIAGCFLAFSTPGNCAPPPAPRPPEVNVEHADLFGRILMQDFRGRLKPMDTFTQEVLRKLARKEKLYGQSAEQIILSMASFPESWFETPIIKPGRHEEIRKILNAEGPLIAYADFFSPSGEYLLKDYVRKAFAAQARDRGAFEKELLKLDEKVNICSMIFSGRFMSVFPLPGDPGNRWQSPADLPHRHHGSGGTFIEEFYPAYIAALQRGVETNDWGSAGRLLLELDQYQQKNGGDILPSRSKIKAELLLNGLNIFGRLGKLYALLGLAFLVLLFTSVFSRRLSIKWPFRIVFGLMLFGFALYTLGLGLRWYVAGRAPWSNGYESMIYIGWTSILAGLVFSRRSPGGLAATTVLASTILMVAGLSWLDPEITPLVPVLKSYWLTIHVSLEAGSYGFLMLGAIIGVLNLVFMILRNRRNAVYVNRVVREMTCISEMTLIGGLIMISIGTYLGGVWANESWGRYWGWDAKETWALVTILVYSFILHMRFIPGLRSIYAFNVASLFGWASVMMTYFGVNYYLSGLHSYAAGDPVPVPPFVYYTVITLIAICGLAYWRNRQFSKIKGLDLLN